MDPQKHNQTSQPKGDYHKYNRTAINRSNTKQEIPGGKPNKLSLKALTGRDFWKTTKQQYVEASGSFPL
jgi:hypothetical protein